MSASATFHPTILPGAATARRAAGAVRAWVATTDGRAALGLLLYIAAYLLWNTFRWFGAAHANAVADVAYLPVYAVAATLALRAARRSGRSAGAWRAWLLLAASLVAFDLGNLIWAYDDLLRHVNPFPSWADAGYLAVYPLLLWGLLSFPAAARTRAERLTFWLDAGTLLLGCWMVVWQLVLAPNARAVSTDDWTTLLLVAYPLADVLALFGLATALLRRPAVEVRRALGWVTGGVALMVAADVLFAWLELRGGYQSGVLVDACYLGQPALLAIGASLHGRRQGAAPAAVDEEAQTPRRVSVLPYAGMALGYGMLLSIGLRANNWERNGLIVGAVALTALIVSRQVVALRENARLLRRSVALAGELRLREARFRSMVQHASDIIAVLDEAGAIRYISPAVLRIIGRPPEELAGASVFERLHPDDVAPARAYLGAVLGVAGTREAIELRFQHAEGSWCCLEVMASNRLADPGVGGIVINARDISDRKRLEQELLRQARHDDLTGLPNRAVFLDDLERALARATRAGRAVAVLFMDLDNFKRVNDSLGHAAGDDVLIATAGRLRGCLRPGDTVARLGGDEFVLLLADIEGQEAALAVARRVLDATRQVLRDAAGEIVVTASVGVALSTVSDPTSDALLRDADTAMYEAKRRGKARHAVYAPELPHTPRPRALPAALPTGTRI